MGFKSRKFCVWLVSLAAVLVVYLLYSWLSKTPQIDIDRPEEFTVTAADSNVGKFGSEIGMIGKVGIGTVQKARYIHLNKEKQVDRELGFEKLLHEEGSEWEIEKPYMNVFRRNFKCYLTADRGKVQVETVVGGRPNAKDATFTGNVVIHILPENSSDIEESYIYLDDVVFISEKSQFSTAGPVKFTSQNAQMLGRGMELVYNDELDQLEFLRIIHLESLRLKTSQAALFSPTTPTNRRTAQTAALSSGRGAETLATASQQVVEQRQGQDYRCVFSGNVVIDTPEQLIFADEVSVNNILWSRTSSRKSNETDTSSTDNVKARNVNVAKQNEPGESHEEFVDIVVTCDNGIVVTPMDSSRAHRNSAELGTKATATEGKARKNFDDATGRTTFIARRIDYCAVTGDAIAGGPTELRFYVNDIMGGETKETSVPVKITTRKRTKFLPALNQVIFEGDCLCTMLREDSNSQQKYTLSAPKITVNLPKDKAKRPSALISGIEHLTATGGVVKLATIKTAGEKLLGGIELKCLKFDVDSGQQMFLATGPGVIKVDNSNISEPEANLGRFSLRRRCYALVRNFDTLKYFLESKRIIADAKARGILIDYIPIVQGQYGKQVAVTTSHIEANLVETADGRTELSTLSATRGISYEEEGIEFEGSEAFYDAKKSIITAHGDEFQPCYFNGALVDAIEYDLETGRVNAEITGPGALQMKK